MKRMLIVIGLLMSSLAAQAGPLEDVLAAFVNAKAQSNEREQTQGIGETVVRAYISSTIGLQVVQNGTTHIGALASKAVCQQAIANAGFALVSTQHRMEFYRTANQGGSSAVIVLAYYDLNGNCSEVYLMDDAL